MRLENKVAVVTGASSGMGKAITTRFVQEGAKVVAVARRIVRLEELAESLKGEPGEIEIFSADIIGKEVGESARTIQRYVRLTYLIPELLELVDKETNGMGLYPAVEISYISQENQKLIYESFKYNDATASMSQAKQLRKLDESNKLTNKKIIEIMQQQKPNQREQFKTSYDNIRKFFPNNYTNAQIDKKILELLELYYKQWNQQV